MASAQERGGSSWDEGGGQKVPKWGRIPLVLGRQEPIWMPAIETFSSLHPPPPLCQCVHGKACPPTRLSLSSSAEDSQQSYPARPW